MSYQAIYRKYRPKNFEEVVGQKHIIKILKNQIAKDNIAHAYLFCGTRGTGKTSTAKIFARAVNCENPIDGNPCNECDVCKGILDQSIMDVVEMDAASNNSVEDIRDLRERVKYLPSKGKKKVYIIDEVHMLSKGAFNAFLKTLEEPPSHLVFILATTEPEKIPATILSRCQRYDFKRIRTEDMVGNMQSITDQMGINIEKRALRLIANNADGAMRDALSILDQCVAFAQTGEEITYEYMTEILGLVNQDLIFDLVDAMINKDLVSVLNQVNYVVQNGKDIHQFIRDLMMHFRNLIMIQLETDLHGLLESTEEAQARYKSQGDRMNMLALTKSIEAIAKIEQDAKFAEQPRVILETGLIQMVEFLLKDSRSDLEERINELEEKLKAGAFVQQNVSAQPTVQTTTRRDTRATNRAESRTKTESKNVQSEQAQSVYQGERSDVTLDEVKRSWSDILQKIRKENVSLFAYLREGYPAVINGNTLKVAFQEDFGFHRSAVDREKTRQYINNVINLHLKANFLIQFVMEDQLGIIQEETVDLVEKAQEIFGEDLVEEIK
ncbi:MAG: DNA polymerase III subunit gamma/tau [Tissierellales bacterium]|jgi:DNA polymerase-3 subunit gamma/tau|nr:DNA polymerase III subunit gamma/tau [Tissierellales bacterium]